MKKALLIFSFILFCVTSYAQEAPKSFTWKTEDLKSIGASEEQISQLTKLTTESRARIKVIKEDTSLSEADKKTKEKEEYAARSEARNKILTPEQVDKVKQITKERRGK